MKTTTALLIRKISGSQLTDLTKEVKETLDISLVPKKEKSFTPADLWKIHKMKRSIPERRYF